jgi:hypothetical protein
MAGAGTVDRHHTEAFRQFLGHAVVEMGHVAAQAVHQQQRRARP